MQLNTPNKPIRICVKLKTQFSKIIIEFSDNGIGIPSAELKKRIQQVLPHLWR